MDSRQKAFYKAMLMAGFSSKSSLNQKREYQNYLAALEDKINIL